LIIRRLAAADSFADISSKSRSAAHLDDMRYLLLSQQESMLGFTPDGEARTGDGRAFLSSQQWFVRALILVGMQTSFQGAMKQY